MFGKIFKGVLIFFLTIWVVYLVMPMPAFPEPVSDAVQSKEPGDNLDPEFFRAYFTDLPRQQVVAHYQQQFHHPGIFRYIPSYRLNYPPEEANKLVRDQLLSTYLEEIVFPFRESLFINGYEPDEDDDKIAFEGRPYFSKVTVRYYPSPVWARLLIAGLSVAIAIWLWKEYLIAFKSLFNKT
jgi:hypothetical protein